MASPPPPPPPAPATGGSKKQTFQTWAKAHHINSAVALDIQRYASAYHLNPYYFAAVLLVESGAQHLNKNGGLKSSGQAVGIAQIANSWVGRPMPWGDHHRITPKDLANYNFNLRFGAYLLSSAVNQYGYAGAYTQGYNPNDPNKNKAWANIQKLLPKGVIPGGTGGGPAATEAPTINTGTQAMQQARQLLDPIYLSYTGRPATPKQLKQWLRNPVSTYQLTNTLSDPKRNPRFFSSPIWKTNYPSYEEIWKGIYGPSSKPDPNAIRYAIVHNLGASFGQRLRDRPDYNTSQEYKGLSAQYGAQYASIFGTPDAQAQSKIDMAVRGGWNTDQWKSYLRSQPEWKSSSEFKQMALGLTSALGFEPGLGAQQTAVSGVG